MAYLTACLPAEQAVTCYAALAKEHNRLQVAAASLIRGRGQVMADTLVERLTGLAHAGDVNVAVQILVPLESLLDPTRPLPAELTGHGPIPAERLLAGGGAEVWRRLVTREGIVIGGDTRSRRFTGRRADPRPRRQPLPRALLRFPDPRDRPHPPLATRRTDLVRQR